MSDTQLTNAGCVLLSVIAVAYGGTFLLRVVNREVPVNELQRTYFRAGHAHAGALITLGLVIVLLMAAADVDGPLEVLADGVLWSAILMPAGFFLSVIGRDPAAPNRLRHLIPVGAAALVVGLLAAGIALIAAGTSGP